MIPKEVTKRVERKAEEQLKDFLSILSKENKTAIKDDIQYLRLCMQSACWEAYFIGKGL